MLLCAAGSHKKLLPSFKISLSSPRPAQTGPPAPGRRPINQGARCNLRSPESGGGGHWAA
uniref:Uncharacterized protein n=1 Tax=Anguilla anguilla TaxID=7936 RepID=A0A0E9U0S6_ANGAN